MTLYYICKYTPVEIIESFRTKAIKLDPSVSAFDNADALMHTNVCFYAKAVLEYCLANKVKELVLVNCCDSIRRLYDILKDKLKFIHLIDLPNKHNQCSVDLFKDEILKFIKAYEKYSKKRFSVNELARILNKKETKTITKGKINIALLGARANDSLIKMIEKECNVMFNFTCTGDHSEFSNPPKTKVFEWYVAQLFNSFPCLRMADVSKRYESLEKNQELIDGVIYHTVKFCDFYNFEYMKIKNIKKPILKIETDYTEKSEGQLKTRLHAFMESLNGETKMITKEKEFTLGIDSGSTSTNIVILDKNKKLVSSVSVKTGAKSRDSANLALTEVLKKANLTKESISTIVATGYGRDAIEFADKKVTEISCHAKGANFLNKKIRTIIDVGGQDSKAIHIDETGKVVNFAMNDKCAAGTGRFLEVSAKTLETPIDDFGKLALKSKEDITISSMCSVFAESEVISLIAQNKNKEDIIQGLCKAISSRIVSLAGRVNPEKEFMMTGGVARNIGVTKELSKRFNAKFFIPKHPELVGALGAALFGFED
ncbi:3-hydroxyacyl-ACP dehydratase [Candidatus Woesearchaeota archaeon]|jgi:predicted CoA-substrate-specific enzyme activase|nr:3-hydroxyacyl-ACP dehydratase [Candidatus Woesearchaeota archaeon]MBT4368208.1 3-hydroxyacyl-ACP dehydratase [Candidatus Woesearchaeota archaeon]MBT4712697.1 3-hydroxyacyl-ACP dehydratase [Candidatus Woesearchaeota archaeon]MBT6639609.1 3-hydroxyacyl-ACP dehydratase [Candidatus Woesearchaeota archaeon]MBT7133781.1 3-hydroxyacyl-ACP dehydratase [Candidatus Woesearchaeota archaeon]